MLRYKDEGHVDLLLRVMANMCDGQNTRLQVDHVSLNLKCMRRMLSKHLSNTGIKKLGS